MVVSDYNTPSLGQGGGGKVQLLQGFTRIRRRYLHIKADKKHSFDKKEIVPVTPPP